MDNVIDVDSYNDSDKEDTSRKEMVDGMNKIRSDIRIINHPPWNTNDCTILSLSPPTCKTISASSYPCEKANLHNSLVTIIVTSMLELTLNVAKIYQYRFFHILLIDKI